MPAPTRVVVVGGGISGLAAAYYLTRSTTGPVPEVTLVEADRHPGGKVRTRPVAGRPVDTGPESLVARVPQLAALLDELGLAAATVAPSAHGAYVWSGGRLRRVPEGLVVGAPERLVPLLRSRLLSAPGLARAGLDVVLPRTRLPEDPSVGEVLRPRFGAEVFDRLVEPLLGGVHAGRADHLSARSTVPDLEALARSHRSLYLALRRRRRRTPTATPGPTLVSLDGGLGRLVDALLARLGAVDLRFGSAVTGLVRDPSGWRVVLGDGTELTADAVVLATPAYATAELLAPHSASGAAALREIGYVDVATVTLAYPAPSVGRRLDATGFLVPPRDGRLVVGCTWLSAKWPHLAGGPEVLVRCLVGRAGDDRWAAYDDAALTEAVHGELVEVLRLAGRPTAVHVQRWPKALPQYAVGHQDRLDRVAAALAGLPGLHVTGAAYRGAGVASCIAQAEQVARLVAATDVPAGVGR